MDIVYIAQDDRVVV